MIIRLVLAIVEDTYEWPSEAACRVGLSTISRVGSSDCVWKAGVKYAGAPTHIHRASLSSKNICFIITRQWQLSSGDLTHNCELVGRARRSLFFLYRMFPQFSLQLYHHIFRAHSPGRTSSREPCLSQTPPYRRPLLDLGGNLAEPVLKDNQRTTQTQVSHCQGPNATPVSDL